MPIYQVLRCAPQTEKTGQISYEDGQVVRWHRVTGWRALGTVEADTDLSALQLAKQRFGGRPVIELHDAFHYV